MSQPIEVLARDKILEEPACNRLKGLYPDCDSFLRGIRARCHGTLDDRENAARLCGVSVDNLGEVLRTVALKYATRPEY